MVPDLHASTHPTDREYWRTMIKEGKTNTLMPGFGVQHGGPLSDAAVESLVEYLVGPFVATRPVNAAK